MYLGEGQRGCIPPEYCCAFRQESQPEPLPRLDKHQHPLLLLHLAECIPGGLLIII